MQSLRQQLVEAEGSRTSHTLNDQLTQLQTEMGRVKNELSVKSDQIEGQRTQLSARQSELDSAQERASTAESMVTVACVHEFPIMNCEQIFIVVL